MRKNAKSRIGKRCGRKLRLIHHSSMSEIGLAKTSAFKLYNGKYYFQRKYFRSPGEPQILTEFPSPFFVKLKNARFNPLRTNAFLEREHTLTECGEWIEMERLSFLASNFKEISKRNLWDHLLAWLSKLRGYMPCSGIAHRDITIEHIMYSKTASTFRLIDFAVAIPDDWTLEPREPLLTADDISQIDLVTELVQQKRQEYNG